MSIISELKRRNVIRVALAYLAGAWLLIQILETLFPIFGMQETSIRVVVVALLIGFVPILIAAWVFELTPGGLVRDTGEDTMPSPGSKKNFDRFIIVVLVLALLVFATDTFILDPARDARNIEAAAKAARKSALVESFGDKSIAVLPFDNMSSDPEQAYFADGISEELLNLLARVEGLRVISRTSSFQFKDSEASLTEIAEILDVAHILEGSVRKSGNTIRITAQLIDAAADTHLWSQTYDREFKDIFAIQDEVAAHVVEQLKFRMSLEPPVAARHDPQAYQLYLQAVQIMEYSRDSDAYEKAKQLLVDALRIEPDYADAKMRLVWVYQGYADDYEDSSDLEQAAHYREQADKLVQEVAALEPGNVQFNTTLAFLAADDLSAAAQYLEQALESEPTNKNALNGAMLLLTRLGRYSSARLIGEYMRSRDPIWYLAPRNLAETYIESGELEMAEQAYRAALAIVPESSTARWRFGLVLLFQGKPEAALEQFELVDSALSYRLQGFALALHALGRLEESAAVMTELAELSGEPGADLYWPYGLARAYAWLGDAENAFRYLEKVDRSEMDLLFLDLNGPFFHPLRNDPRWQSFLESVGRAPEQLAEIEFNPRLPVEILAAIENDNSDH